MNNHVDMQILNYSYTAMCISVAVLASSAIHSQISITHNSHLRALKNTFLDHMVNVVYCIGTTKSLWIHHKTHF